MKKLASILSSIAIALTAITFFAVPVRADLIAPSMPTTTSSPAPTEVTAPEPETETTTDQTTSDAATPAKEEEPIAAQEGIVFAGIIVGAIVVAAIASLVLFKE